MNIKAHNPNSALSSSHGMPRLRVSSAILSNSIISDGSNSISSMTASLMTVFFAAQAMIIDYTLGLKRLRKIGQESAASPSLPEGGSFCRRSSWKASGQREPEPGGRRGERMFLASRKSLHKPNSALRSSQDMPHLRVLSASLSISSVSAVSNSISSIEVSRRSALSEELTMISSPHFQA